MENEGKGKEVNNIGKGIVDDVDIGNCIID